jgi:hypothetical protein
LAKLPRVAPSSHAVLLVGQQHAIPVIRLHKTQGALLTGSNRIQLEILAFHVFVTLPYGLKYSFGLATELATVNRATIDLFPLVGSRYAGRR